MKIIKTAGITLGAVIAGCMALAILKDLSDLAREAEKRLGKSRS